MKIKLLTSIASDRESYRPGEIVDFPDDYALRLIATDQAEALEQERPAAKKKAKPSKTADKKPAEER